MEHILQRPFYTAFAWAYDLIIQGAVGRRCDFWEAAAARCGVRRGARVLDAGCGTGSYAIELARRGYHVTGLDVSPDLLAVARAKARDAGAGVTFRLGDIVRLAPDASLDAPFDGILCRGVLNDLLDDASRRQAFHAFAAVLRPGGLLVVDVREWQASVARYSQAPVFERQVETPEGWLHFQSVSWVDPGGRRLLVSERHALARADGPVVVEYEFAMRPWTPEELHEALAASGFGEIAFYNSFEEHATPGETDRIVAVACKGRRRED